MWLHTNLPQWPQLRIDDSSRTESVERAEHVVWLLLELGSLKLLSLMLLSGTVPETT
jgi:hypothetical protein